MLLIKKPHSNIMSEKKIINKYLHYYVGATCRDLDTGEKFGLTYNMLYEMFLRNINAKLILRPVSTITETEKLECIKLVNNIDIAQQNATDLINALKTQYYLRKGFDLFGLLDDGLAEAASTNKETSLLCS